MSRSYDASSTGNIGPANGGMIGSAVCTAAAATSTLVLREAGSTGRVILTLSAVANTSAVHTFNEAVDYDGQLHATVTGASMTGYVEIT